jgi:hypothetical protein
MAQGGKWGIDVMSFLCALLYLLLDDLSGLAPTNALVVDEIVLVVLG